MSSKWIGVSILLVVVLTNCLAAGQASSDDTNKTPAQPEVVEKGGYAIHQSIELGYRTSDVTGNEQMYGTLVNLPSGPRLLEQSLSMQSQDHTGLLFDNLFVNSFGWGGEPNNALRARVDKNKWYDFRASFRRDLTDFDYNLLGNPLNPPTSRPSIPVPFSPHLFATSRRMTDVDLTVLPESKVDFRFGYSRNNTSGPSYSSVHEGTDALLFQQWDSTLNSYRFGADVKILPQTVISYDQFLDYYDGNTAWRLAPFSPALLPGFPGTVELGLPIDTANKNPCSINKPATTLIDAAGTLTNITCNGFFDYTRSNPVRTFTPTEHLSLHSTYFQRLELSASYSYSSADMHAPWNEFFNGLISRSRTRQTTVTGTGEAQQISNIADFSATVHLTEHVRLVDTFRYWAYRIPQASASVETDFNVPGSGSCVLPGCSLLIPITDTIQNISDTSTQTSFNQSWTTNQADLVWDVSKHFGARAGFRYGDKIFHNFLDFTTGDEDRIVIHEYTPLFAFWARPTANLRLNVDLEHTNNSDAIVRIGPRKEDRYRFQSTYSPKPWAVIALGINLWNASNDDKLIEYHGHNRTYGLTATLTPRKTFGFDLAYNYNNYQQNAFICFDDSDNSLPVVANAGNCGLNGFNDFENNPHLTYGIYRSRTHYGMGALTFKPLTRLTTEIGYSIVSVAGETPQFNALQPFGSLQYNYHEPLGKIAIDVGHNVSVIARWNYYQYGEKSFVGPTDPRYFHANNETISLRWAF